MAPLAKPITPPTPTAKPERADDDQGAEKRDADTASDDTSGTDIVGRCGPANIVSRPAPDGETLLYRTTFAPDMVDTKIAEGCGQFFQGCNVCTVSYVGCGDAERDTCKTPECLEKTCERRVRCTTKTCEVRGRAPTCEARMARTNCLREMFD